MDMILRPRKDILTTREYAFIAVRSFGLPVPIPRLALKNAAMNTAFRKCVNGELNRKLRMRLKISDRQCKRRG